MDFKAENVLSEDDPSYWIGGEILGGIYWLGHFILDFGMEIQIDGVELRNIKASTDRHAKEIKVYVASNEAGPWHEILHEELPDTRFEDDDDLPNLHFGAHGQNYGRYIKCENLQKHGNYGGLEFFTVYSGSPIKEIICVIY